MNQQEAVDAVLAQSHGLGISRSAGVVSAERAIVEYTPDRERPGPVQDRLVWIVTLASSQGLTKVHVEDSSRKVLEVIR